jgi:hypothetical protein
LRRGDEPIQCARLAYNRRDLRRGLHQHADLVFPENALFDRLHNENALQHAPVDQRNTQKRLIGLFASLTEVFEARMILYLFHRDGPNLLGHQARKPFIQGHPKIAHAVGTQSQRCG